MLRRWVGALFLVFLLVVLVGLLLSGLAGQRSRQNRVYSLNNLRELGMFATSSVRPGEIEPVGPGMAGEKKRVEGLGVLAAIPPGTLPHDRLSPERRISWVPIAAPYFNQKRQNVEALMQRLNRTAAWDDETNRELSHTVIESLIPTALNQRPDPALPAPTYYPGIGGLGVDAASFPLNDPRAGAFRYDSATPFDRIGDGLRTSFLFVETGHGLGPWIQGGPATVRTVPSEGALLGLNSPLGGIHAGYTIFGYCDGSAGVLTDRTDPRVIRALSTINGNETLRDE